MTPCKSEVMFNSTFSNSIIKRLDKPSNLNKGHPLFVFSFHKVPIRSLLSSWSIITNKILVCIKFEKKTFRNTQLYNNEFNIEGTLVTRSNSSLNHPWQLPTRELKSDFKTIVTHLKFRSMVVVDLREVDSHHRLFVILWFIKSNVIWLDILTNLLITSVVDFLQLVDISFVS